jgi:hypothetical protein
MRPARLKRPIQGDMRRTMSWVECYSSLRRPRARSGRHGEKASSLFVSLPSSIGLVFGGAFPSLA